MPDVALLRGVDLRYGKRWVLRDLSLNLGEGQSVAIIGPSGVGKSTLLSVVAGLQQPSAGRVVVAGKDLTRMRPREVTAHRARNIGIVFQHAELVDELSPLENVMLPGLWVGGAASDMQRRAAELLEAVGVSTGAARSASLSGGERQRVAVARALMCRPRLLLADEPTGSLDAQNAGRVADLLFDLPHGHTCGLLVVTHDHRVAARADRCVELKCPSTEAAGA